MHVRTMKYFRLTEHTINLAFIGIEVGSSWLSSGAAKILATDGEVLGHPVQSITFVQVSNCLFSS